MNGAGTPERRHVGAVGVVWAAASDSFYAMTAAATFLWLQALTLFAEWTAAGSASAFLFDQIGERVLRFSVASFLNSIAAGIWPLSWISQLGVLRALAAMALTYALFRLLRRYAAIDSGRAA